MDESLGDELETLLSFFPDNSCHLKKFWLDIFQWKIFLIGNYWFV